MGLWILLNLMNVFVHVIMIAYIPFSLFRAVLVWCGIWLFAAICCYLKYGIQKGGSDA